LLERKLDKKLKGLKEELKEDNVLDYKLSKMKNQYKINKLEKDIRLLEGDLEENLNEVNTGSRRGRKMVKV